MAELWEMAAWELSEQVRTRQVSNREVVQAHLCRIQGVNPRVNAVTAVLAEEALAAADAADWALQRGERVGPLCGVGSEPAHPEFVCLDAAAVMAAGTRPLTPIEPRWW